MERKIGEIFEYNGEWYQSVKSQGKCYSCDLFVDDHCVSDFSLNGSCFYCHRKDGENIMFRKLERVGEPYTLENKKFQKYRVFHTPYIYNKVDCSWQSFADPYYVSLEISSTKEDMEEKTIKIKKEDIKVGNKVICLSNSKPYVITEVNCRMKYNGEWNDCVIYTPLYDNPYKCFVRPIEDFAQNFVLDSAEEEKHSNSESTGKNLKLFDLQKAKEGKPVCTRDGRKARIICFDFRDADEICCIIAAVDYGEAEKIHYYDLYGKYRGGDSSEYDLMILPEKKEGWINVYNSLGIITFSHNPFDTEEEALTSEIEFPNKNYIDTIKIEWEE